jgi:hypothetical protein
MTHRVGLQDMDIGEASDSGPFGLTQQVQVGPEIHFAIAQPVCLPGNPESRDDQVDAAH